MIGTNVIIDISKDRFLRFGAFVREDKLSKQASVNQTQKTKDAAFYDFTRERVVRA